MTDDLGKAYQDLTISGHALTQHIYNFGTETRTVGRAMSGSILLLATITLTLTVSGITLLRKCP